MKVRLGHNEGGWVTPKKQYTPEEIIQHLWTVERGTGKGLAVLDACRKLGITEQRCGIRLSTGSCFIRSRKHRS